MQITPQDFPLTAQGASIYGQMNSSPLLTAASDQIARITVWLLNEGYEGRIAMMQDGCWTGPDRRGMMGATVL